MNLLNKLQSLISRAVVNSGSALYQVLWAADRVSAQVEHAEPQGVHFRVPVEALGVLVCPGGDPGASILLNAQGAVPSDALEPGEGGLHFLGTYKAFCKADGSLVLGALDSEDGVGVDSLIEARFTELKTATLAALGAITPAGGGPAAVTAFNNSLNGSNPLWPSPTGSAVVKVEP